MLARAERLPLPDYAESILSERSKNRRCDVEIGVVRHPA